MKRVIILIYFSIQFLNGQYVHILENDLTKINSSVNKNFIINRLNQYNTLLKTTKDFPIYKKLSYINNFFNKIFPIEDSKKYSFDDYWATPKEFLINGIGDCEDYVISKYFSLISIGVDKKQLYFSVVRVKNATEYHMVLFYKKDDILLVLDNLNQKILPLEKREDLTPRYAFNEFEIKSIKESKLYKSIKLDWKGNNKFERLLNRVYHLNE